MATALLGKIDNYDPAREEWTQYVERLEQFFEANDLTGEDKAAKRRATFLSVIGPEPYKLLRSLLSPEKPSAKSFEELVAKLTEHYSPPPPEVIQRFRFNSRSRQPGESVSTYMADLRRLAEQCNYGTTLEKMLRDRIVYGINDERIREKLLEEKDLSYKRALEIAQGVEAANKNLKEMKAPKPEPTAPAPVHKVPSRRPPPTHERGQNPTVKCHRCGAAGHLATTCRFRDRTCYKCGKKGHLAKVCRSKPRGDRSRRQRTQPVQRIGDDFDDDSDDTLQPVLTVKGTGGSLPPIKVHVLVDNCSVPMEVDTGASVTLISESTFFQLWPGRGLSETSVRLQTYSKEPLVVMGTTEVDVSYQGQSATLPLVVVKGQGPTLLGRNWLGKIRLNWGEIHYTRSPGLHQLLGEYEEIFQEGLGTFRGYEAKIEVDPAATPRFCKARPIPYAMRSKVEDELTRLVAEGTLEPVDYSDWAAPIVAVIKSDKTSVRVCGDFRMTVNPISKLNRYPIPRVEDLFATLGRGQCFTKLDLSQAYQQLQLDQESRKYVVINTHKGLFRYTRLPYGISSAPGIFQKVMESLLQGIPQVTVYLDDILISGETEAAHLQSLGEVLKRLARAGLRVKKHKCEFMVPSVTYLGHIIDAQGLHPLPDKVEAIQQAPAPRNVTELKSYLGLLTYYGKFLPNLATRLASLYRLLSKDVPWRWTDQHAKAFDDSKKLLLSANLLVHFNPKFPLLLACDASAYGMGAVLAHRMPDGSEKPIGYASRTLNSAERNYSQLEKEGLSCIFGIKKFYSYLLGHSFTLITDHKPLLGLLSETKPTSQQASARIRRWSLYLSMFEYTLCFRNTTAHANADALSRLPLRVEPAVSKTPPELVLLAEHLSSSPVTADQIRSHTRRDPQLAKVVQFVQQGWPSSCPAPELLPFFERRDELSLFEGCLLWGARVIVPPPCRDAVLVELHEGHPGTSRMKSLARMYVWWPGSTKDIETTVRHCSECQQHQSTPPVAPLHPWSWPTRPWARLHIDYAGPVHGRMILVIIDAHSKWIEAICTATATSSAVIEELRTLFSQFGIPETIVSDNGTCFVSTEFEAFLSDNGIKHVTSAPYHPSSNGLAERAVQVVKRGLRKVTKGTMRSRLAKILFAYRLTPQTTTGISPGELLLGRRPRSRLDLLKPHTADRVERKQIQQKERHDLRAKGRELKVGDNVFVRNYHRGERWLPGVIKRKTGPVSFVVQLTDGRDRRCHQDQLRRRTVTSEDSDDSEEPPPESSVIVPEFGTSYSPATPVQSSMDDPASESPPDMSPDISSANPTDDSETHDAEPTVETPDPPDNSPTIRSYPTRVRNPVNRYEPTW